MSANRKSLGKCILAGALVLAFASPDSAAAAGFRLLHFFKRTVTDGKYDGTHPEAGLIVDKAGNLYGTTDDGGGPEDVFHGTVFKLAPDGTETVLYAFLKPRDGDGLYGELIMDKAGNLYSTTASGGRGCHNLGCGVVFEITP